MSQNQPRPAANPKAKQATPRAAATAKPAENPDEFQEEESANRFLFFNVMPSWMVSFLTHIAIIIVLAIMVLPPREERTVALEASDSAVEALDSIDLDILEFDDSEVDPFETEITEDQPTEVTEEVETALVEAEVEFSDLLGAEEVNLDADPGLVSDSELKEETGSRSGAGKTSLLKKYGGTAASEEAVALALKWIIKHQLPDGGWDLDHTRGPGNFRDSTHPGNRNARNGATALAILPLLGAGHTHKTGEYKNEVRAGLDYLMKNGRKSGRGLSYLEQGGTMYSHGLVAIVFGEAYAMTKDSTLAPFAQQAIWYIEDAQDPSGGGWRYRPREPGDTSAVGWQVMALKSGKISGLSINPRTYKRTEKFLDSVSTSGGAFYGYTSPPRGKPADARTAVGLLCRMYMGWDKSNPGMQDGSSAIAEKGPDTRNSGADMYYNYYATQMIKHLGGSDWKAWNSKMRDFLVKKQETKGNAAGSWHFGGSNHASEAGGRLFNTSLACMTLEVYYRYLPLYGDKASNDEFPLE